MLLSVLFLALFRPFVVLIARFTHFENDSSDTLSNCDGILGLVFPVVSSNPGVPTVLAKLVSADMDIFTFYLGGKADKELVVGGTTRPGCRVTSTVLVSRTPATG